MKAKLCAHSLTLKKTREGMELRLGYSFKDRRPTTLQARKMSYELLREALAALEGKNVVDGGFRENATKRSGVTQLVLDGGSR